MSLHARLEELRSKPEHVRKRMAFWSSLGITAVIFAFWLSGVTSAGSNIKTEGVLASVAEKAGPPAQSLTASVGSLFADIRDLIWTPKRVEYGTIEVVPGE